LKRRNRSSEALLGIGTYLLGLLVGAVCLATLHGISRSRRARA
jgi:hypothetical protein